jgi:hypothetical protein
MEGVLTTFSSRRGALRGDPRGFVAASAFLPRAFGSLLGNQNSPTEFFGRRKKTSTQRKIISQKNLPPFEIAWQYLSSTPGREEVLLASAIKNGTLVSRTQVGPEIGVGRSERSERAGDPPGRPFARGERWSPGGFDSKPGNWDHPTHKRARRSARGMRQWALQNVLILRAGSKSRP